MGEIELDVWKDVYDVEAVLSKGFIDARDVSLQCRSSVTACCAFVVTSRKSRLSHPEK